MARREPQKTDFTVDVEGVGQFIFARRTMRDEIKIQQEFARYIGGLEPTEWLLMLGGWLSTLSVLIVSEPDGWLRDIDGHPVEDVMDSDPLDGDTYETLKKVHGALRDKEDSFRRKHAQGGQAERQRAGEDN
ncbi:hypothetical protein K32_49340 [Kaistia sp. 32K]|uniref:hypothetical protein n=1 Tax=Kaistia sp. 32K TaxID=2795690 RepID=UPI001915209C|nr:hypothetical protein [Kaistia sp. 32K]BCP56317.1 hypothetical protein K32_49340 [Kaistia sp. 32K]